jgi:hypothetical protein
MSGWEQAAAFRGDLSLPLAAVRTVSVEPEPWSALRGIRAPGTGFPGLIAYGTRRLTGERPDFAAILRRRPAVRVELDPPSAFGRLLVTVPEPDATVRRLRAATSL